MGMLLLGEQCIKDVLRLYNNWPLIVIMLTLHT